MRGLAFVQVPTTLLAQVDAAIGGKTAVNLPEGKNLVGAFAQPLAVLADVDTLATLEDRDYRSGLSEVAKVALTLDPELPTFLRERAAAVTLATPRPSSSWWPDARPRRRVVGEDERDTSAASS